MGLITTDYHDGPIEIVEFPDVELMVVIYLSDLLGDGVRVTAKLGDDDFPAAGPIVLVTQLDAVEVIPKVMDRVVIDLTMWALDLTGLNALSRQVRSLMLALDDGAVIGDGGVSQSSTFSGHHRTDEDDTTVVRADYSVALFVRPMNY